MLFALAVLTYAAYFSVLTITRYNVRVARWTWATSTRPSGTRPTATGFT
ncbi:MAG: hypothetical protein R3A10_08495 [Caldilineaceae bacterium]